ncbi:MAG TPA: hypothetical protein VLT36_02930 [Candidatus Dormibacteraeota bacterium]|nr:hypothetical protein [Candidatus Dormibacteraeota bacterium]
MRASTNIFDACWGANTLGLPGETTHGWQVRAFPRRTRTIGLRFLSMLPDGEWTNVADFHIPNPAYAEYPQWQPVPLPNTQTDGNLEVTLREFQSGARMGRARGTGNAANAARKTRLVFSFAQHGQESKDWRAQKLTISDATGNNWFPYLDLLKQDFNWATNGTIEFFGALWTGEQAWKLDLEVTRTSGFDPEELWDTEVPLPGRGALLNLTNTWEHDNQTVHLVAVGSPDREDSGDFRWVAKWWGEDKDKVFSLAIKVSPEKKGQKLTLIRAVDQDGNDVKLVELRNQEYCEQAVFFKPSDEATNLHLKFALQRSRFVHFTARPDFQAEK